MQYLCLNCKYRSHRLQSYKVNKTSHWTRAPEGVVKTGRWSQNTVILQIVTFKVCLLNFSDSTPSQILALAAEGAKNTKYLRVLIFLTNVQIYNPNAYTEILKYFTTKFPTHSFCLFLLDTRPYLTEQSPETEPVVPAASHALQIRSHSPLTAMTFELYVLGFQNLFTKSPYSFNPNSLQINLTYFNTFQNRRG